MNKEELIAYERKEAQAMAYKEVEKILMQSLSNAQMMVGMNNSEMREMGGKELLRREGRAWGLNAWFQQTQRDMEKLVELYKKTQS